MFERPPISFMVDFLPPFAYLDSPITDDKYSPTWGHAWALFYMIRRRPIPEDVRLCVLESARVGRKGLDEQFRGWNFLVQDGAGERFGITYSRMQDSMITSLERTMLSGPKLAERIGILAIGVEILEQRVPARESQAPRTFVER